ncbi:unnamed protein product, partial [Candidula unifasciata]
MKVMDVFLLATLAVLVLILACTHGESARDSDLYASESDSDRVARWILDHLTDIRRDRRTRIDAGFLSRHSALQNFLNSYDAGLEAADPHGPGRRK